MIPEAQDFLDESAALELLLTPLTDGDLEAPTAFKRWPIGRIVRHLHVWNMGAALALTMPGHFQGWLDDVAPHLPARTIHKFEEQICALSGQRLVTSWRDECARIARVFATADPKARVAWPGQSMSARSSITARLMETWAHGQAIYDELGITRTETDRIRGIALLGVNTYDWSFRNRGLTPPQPRPSVRLTAPSGAIWLFGEEREDERIEGSATEFCQVVAQTRNISDTALTVTGPNASAWMAVAQCFAGPPEDPPSPGTRRRRSRPRA